MFKFVFPCVLVLSLLILLTSLQPTSAHTVKFMQETIKISHGVPIFSNQPANFFCTAKKPCLEFKNVTNKTITIHWHFTDPTHFRSFTLKPGQKYDYTPELTNWHEVFRIFWHGSVGDVCDVQTY
jgi:hypothetical protein